NGLAHAGIGKMVGHVFAVGFVGESLADLGQIVLAVGIGWLARLPPIAPTPRRPGSLAPNFGDHGPSDSALAAFSGWRLCRPAAERPAARCASRDLCSGGAPRRYPPSYGCALRVRRACGRGDTAGGVNLGWRASLPDTRTLGGTCHRAVRRQSCAHQFYH